MSGCSLDEAFPDTALQSGRVARKEEKKKAQKCKGPALTFLKSQEDDDFDPDRPAVKPSPHPKPLSRPTNKEGFVTTLATTYEEEAPKWTPKHSTPEDERDSELVKNLVGQRVDDVIGQKQRSTLPKASIIRPSPAQQSSNSNYFGKSLEDISEKFADFNKSITDNPGYQILSADLGSFGAVGLERSAGQAALSTPSVNDAWKPLTPSGARSSFFEHLPSPGGMSPREYDSSFSRQEKESLLKKLDTLFARLEELESKRNEYAHTEISLFILSGLFLMFGIETARKMI